MKWQQRSPFQKTAASYLSDSDSDSIDLLGWPLESWAPKGRAEGKVLNASLVTKNTPKPTNQPTHQTEKIIVKVIERDKE